jgi:hypothetical protein
MRRVSNHGFARREKHQKSQKHLIDGHNFISCESFFQNRRARLRSTPRNPAIYLNKSKLFDIAFWI